MKRIPATLGYEIIVDDEDFEAMSRHRWYAHNCGSKGRNKGKRPARRTSVKEGRKVRFLVHHLVRAEDGLVVDHINGDPWDNRRCNLRICTHAENLRNTRKRKTTDGNPYKGAYRIGRRWRCTITYDGKLFMVGWFDTAEAAAMAYDAAALALHGEFARLNFPDIGTKPRHPSRPMNARRERLDVMCREAIARIKDGETATSIAKDFGLSVTTISVWAKKADVRLRVGRPLLAPEPTQAAA